MQSLNKWITDTLGEWTLDCYGLFIIIAAVLAVVLIAVIIAVAVCHAKNKKKIKELREQVRRNSDATAAETNELDEARLASLNDALIHKQTEIDELKAQLAQAESAAAETSVSDTGAEAAYKAETEARVNDLYRTINELNETNKEQANEINLLKAENAQIKAQALQQRIASSSAETTAANAAPDEEDEYDEYYDEYGDENSAVKVTLKFDRIRNNWIILRSDTDRTYRRLATKQEALVIAKDLARRLHAQLVVHKKDGKFQRV